MTAEIPRERLPIERVEHENGHIEIRTCHPKGEATISHWLRYQKNIEVVDEDGKEKTCRIAIAYRLEKDDKKKKPNMDWKIIPLKRGQVSIYFPAEKEISNLRFHINAPFASTVARDSVRDCESNRQLRDHVTRLVVESIYNIRDRGMLTMGFLAVLPNPADNLPPFYEPIREAIVNAFRDEFLTPTKTGSHAPANGLYRGPAKVAEVIDDEDLAFLTGYDAPLWAANPPQQNQQEDRFLDSLEIDKFGWTEVIKILSVPNPIAWAKEQKIANSEHRCRIEEWVQGKDDLWIMRFYALLGEACSAHEECFDAKEFSIVRVEAGPGHDHVLPNEAFFPQENESTQPPQSINFVKPSVYNIGRSESQKRSAAKFLEDIGVRTYDSKAAIELIINRYKNPPDKIPDSYFSDLVQFILYYKKNPTNVTIFSDRKILIGTLDGGALRWCSPDELCIDSPYVETGLAELVKIHKHHVVWDGYERNIAEDKLVDFIHFLSAAGVMQALKIRQVRTSDNPCWSDLRKDLYATRWTHTSINEDYSLPNIEQYLSASSVPASRLIWEALINADQKVAIARFRPNQQYQTRKTDSQLVYHLKTNAWVPDRSGVFRTPQEMTKYDLRDEFPYDDRNGLLTAIGFGDSARKRSEEYVLRNNQAQDMGFNSADEADIMAQLAKILREKDLSPEYLIAQYKLKTNEKLPTFPKRSVVNQERRQDRFTEQFAGAPDKKYEKRQRSVRISSADNDAITWLRNQYTNEADQMVCQICKEEMPFRKRNGEHYFEKKEVFSRKFLSKEHVAQYLALCPLCAAKYEEFVKSDENVMVELTEAIVIADDCEVPISLGDQETSIRFVETHYHDLKAIIADIV